MWTVSPEHSPCIGHTPSHIVLQLCYQLPDVHLTTIPTHHPWHAFSASPFFHSLWSLTALSLLTGPPGRHGEDTRSTCRTHLPSRIPIRHGPLQINNSLVSSRNGPSPPTHIPNSSRHGTLPPSRIPLSTRYITKQTKLTQPLPLATYQRTKHPGSLTF